MIEASSICTLCNRASSLALASDDVIRGHWGSIHHNVLFAWIAPQAEFDGPICDNCIDRLVAKGAIGAYASALDGPMPHADRKTLTAAFMLGAARGAIAVAAAGMMDAGDPEEAKAILGNGWGAGWVQASEDGSSMLADMLCPPPSDTVIRFGGTDNRPGPDAYAAGLSFSVAQSALGRQAASDIALKSASKRFCDAVERSRDAHSEAWGMLSNLVSQPHLTMVTRDDEASSDPIWYSEEYSTGMNCARQVSSNSGERSS